MAPPKWWVDQNSRLQQPVIPPDNKQTNKQTNHNFSRVLRASTPRYVGPSVGPSVGRSPFWAAATKGLMTYAFTHIGNFLLLLLLLLLPPPLHIKANIPLCLEALIPASKLNFQPRGLIFSLKAQISFSRRRKRKFPICVKA